MRLIVSPEDGTEILRVMTFGRVDDMAANIAPGETAHLLPQGLGLIDQARLCVIDNVLTPKPGVTEPVQHVGEQVLPHSFRVWG